MINKIGYIIRYCVNRIKNRGNIYSSNIALLGPHSDLYTFNGKIRLGRRVSTDSSVHLSAVEGGILTIGNNVFINRNCIIVSRKEIIIGDHCSIAPNVAIYDHDHKYNISGMEKGYSLDSVIIEDHCWIGSGCIILRGTHIGRCSVIGAGCVIKGEIPPHSLVTSDHTLKIKKISKGE